MNLRHRISAIIEATSSIMTAYTGNPIRNSIINGTDIIKIPVKKFANLFT